MVVLSTQTSGSAVTQSSVVVEPVVTNVVAVVVVVVVVVRNGARVGESNVVDLFLSGSIVELCKVMFGKTILS